jgi:hypothetical protein
LTGGQCLLVVDDLQVIGYDESHLRGELDP